jgi:hypothetical protein
MRLRWSSGASLSTSGTEFLSVIPNCDIAGKGAIVTLTGTVAGLSGQVTAGVTAVRDSGGGTVSCFGSTGQTNKVLVEAI